MCAVSLLRSAGLALVAVLRAQLLEQLDRVAEGRDALHRAVRHVGGRLPLAAHGRARRRLATRGTRSSRCRRAPPRGAAACSRRGRAALTSACSSSTRYFTDGHPPVGRVHVRVGGEAFAVADAGRGVDREDARAAGRRPGRPDGSTLFAVVSRSERRRHPLRLTAGRLRSSGCSDRRRARRAASSPRRRSRRRRARTASRRSVFTPSRSKLYDMYQRCLVRRAFESAPFLSSASIRSR